MKIVAVIPARMGSDRLKNKNMLKINNKTLVKIAADKCIDADCFQEVYINSESDIILDEARRNVKRYKREEKLANNYATSEDFIRDFLKNVDCDYLFQIHTIAPLITIEQIRCFVKSFIESKKQVGLCYEKIILETVDVNNDPINFSYSSKQNSQQLDPVKKISWAMTGWKVKNIMPEDCISFGSSRYFHEVDKYSCIVIKELRDYEICKKLLEDE